MDPSRVVLLFIDWGYTRLKIWTYDTEGTRLSEISTYTSNISKSSSFYDNKDIQNACLLIKDALRSCLPASKIYIYTCSQMHALAGILEEDDAFLSTWHDLAESIPSGDNVNIHNGIPALNSMPLNKILAKDHIFSLRSSYNARVSHHSASIKALSSPVNLLLHKLFHTRLPCSSSWWQSTCLSIDYLKLDNNREICYLSESPLFLPPGRVSALLETDIDVLIFPEVGDLQASTYTYMSQCQILLNLGTGSQIIFPRLNVTGDLPYYRFYNQTFSSVPTISHIPCGRLLADYAHVTTLSFAELRKILSRQTAFDVRRIGFNTNQTLLCFPGFSFHDCAYHQQPTTTMEALAKLDPGEFLCLWVFQYYKIIEHFYSCPHSNHSVCFVGVVGDLGGFSHDFIALLATLLPSTFQLRPLPSADLPPSLLYLYSESPSPN